ncbi:MULTISPECIES: iron-containing alcohol dehydrogenase family protein [Bacillus]|uniref:iron-containing alcohol dehydrogenase family protein n=1 Tax=Bacillus TaxID=1386 RepID=UPI000302870C|nr:MULTISPECIES: iron-containing alcohol dehydrogenase family protein [Bacillus]
MEIFSVHGAPSEYILAEGALNLLEKKLLERGLKKVLVVTGKKSWNAAEDYWPEINKVHVSFFHYQGECSLTEIDKVANLVVKQNYEAIIGVGGGKVLDLAKAACNQTHKQAILIPTLASNCAPWTPLSVLYDDDGSFIRYDIYPVCSSLVLIEPNILLQAPIEMLVAGIGDTLAKWYEADVQMATIANKPVALEISHYTAKQCKEVLVTYSKEALNAVENESLNEAFIKVVETIIVYAGMVGGFGDRYGRIAGAHAIHNGLTVLEETHHALHGDKVAYGILVQLVLEEKWKEIEGLLPFYRELGLPYSLTQLGVKELSENIMAAIAKKATAPEESIHVMPIGTITAGTVQTAIVSLEKYVSKI